MATEMKTATKKKTAAKKKRKEHVRTPRYVNMDKALEDIDGYPESLFDREVFTYIAGWVQWDGRTWPESPSLKTIIHNVAPDAESSLGEKDAQYLVSFSVHRLEDAGLLRIYQDCLKVGEHPRNIYMIPSRYMLDVPKNTEDSVQAETITSAPVETEDTPSEPGNVSRSDDTLRKLADLLADYHKNQNILAVGLQGAENVAARIRGGQDHLAAVTLRRISDFLQDALA